MKQTILLLFAIAPWLATLSIAQSLPSTLVSECDFCMCSQGISPLEMGGSGARLDFRYTELSHEYVDGTRIPNASNLTETYLTNQFSFTHQLAESFSATIVVPYAFKHEATNLTGSVATSLSNAGIGDISILGRYNLLVDRTCGDTHVLSLTGGIKFANGTTTLMDDGEPADADLQLGTGTTDFLIGAGYLRGFDTWSIGASVLGGFRGFGRGSNGHVYGNTLNYDVTARYRILHDLGGVPDVLAALGLRGEWRGYEQQDGQAIEDSGGDVAYVAPGLQIFFTPVLSFEATVWFPFLHALHGDQVAETIKCLAGIQYQFSHE